MVSRVASMVRDVTMNEERQTGDRDSAIRRADPSEAGVLIELALRSKGHWGYDSDFLAACRDDLALSAEEIATSAVFVHDDAGDVTGYYRLLPLEGDAVDLDALFVEPIAIGRGVGRRLWRHAVAAAAELGCAELVIQSDPHAEGFYLAMGAQRTGELESTVTPGRMLPLLHFPLR
jgi:GNAT superfamily N-acetyltransferase